MIKVLNIRTSKRCEFVDITHLVRQVVAESGVKTGVCFIHVPHTTAGIIINENADPDVVKDIDSVLRKLVPEYGNYKHLEGNSDAHIKSILVNPQTFILIEDGEIVLGTWQGIFFCEFDGPRNRKVYLKIVEG